MERYRIINQHLLPIKKRAIITVGEKYKNPRTGRYKTLKHRIYIEPCQESYEQWGALPEILCYTIPIANQLVKNNFQSF